MNCGKIKINLLCDKKFVMTGDTIRISGQIDNR